MAPNETPKSLKGHGKLLAGILIVLALAAMGLAPTVFSSTPPQPGAQSVDADLAGPGCGGVGDEPPGGCGGGGCAIPQPEATAAPDCSDCDGDCDNCPKAACEDCDGDCDDCAASSSKADDTRAQASTSDGPQINTAKCTGCGKCVKIAPKTFALNRATKKAYVKNPTGDAEPIIRRAARICPAKAITTK